MARRKARVDFLYVIGLIELFSLAVTAEALQGKTCQDPLLSGGVGKLEQRLKGKGSSLGNIFWFLQN